LHPYTLAHDMVLGCFWKIAAYTVTLVQVGVDVMLVQLGVDFKKVYSNSLGVAACPNVEKCTNSRVQGGDKACEGGGRVHHPVKGGEVKSNSLSRESKLRVTWNLGPNSFFEKNIGGN
jgi:hypothetical protein